MYKYVKDIVPLPQTIPDEELNQAVMRVEEERHQSDNEEGSEEEGLYCELCRVYFDSIDAHLKKQRHQRLQKKFFYDYHRFLKKIKVELNGPRFIFRRCNRLKKLKFLNKLYTFSADN